MELKWFSTSSGFQVETNGIQVEFKWNSNGIPVEFNRRFSTNLNGFKWNSSGFPLQVVFKWKLMEFKWNSSVFQVEIYEFQVDFK